MLEALIGVSIVAVGAVLMVWPFARQHVGSGNCKYCGKFARLECFGASLICSDCADRMPMP